MSTAAVEPALVERLRAHVPPDLAERRHWVLWRRVERGGRATKEPRRVAAPGTRASSTDPRTWSTFDRALSAVAQGAASGVGFVFSPDDPFAGVDLDGCRDVESGDVEPSAVAIVRTLGSYTEVSPSGSGLHVIVRAAMPDGCRNRTMLEWRPGKVGGFECYSTGRFFCITGDVTSANDGLMQKTNYQLAHTESTFSSSLNTIPENQVGLETVLSWVFPPERPGTVSQATRRPGTVELDDRELLERAMRARGGDDFRALWEGRWEALGYGSQSEADLALAGRLAFWTGGDAGRVDALFRRSGLMREKWDSQRGDSTYGRLTIAKALGSGLGR